MIDGLIEPVTIRQTPNHGYEVRNADGSLFLLAGSNHGRWIAQLLKDRAERDALRDARRRELEYVADQSRMRYDSGGSVVKIETRDALINLRAWAQNRITADLAKESAADAARKGEA